MVISSIMWRRAKGGAVLLIPGSFDTYRSWNRIVPLLSSRFRLLALDYLGTGDSDKPSRGFRYTVQEQAALIGEMTRQLGLGRVHLVGASYGGAIVLNLAAHCPELVKSVVSIEGGLLKPKSLPGSPMESALRYPVLGDLFIALARTGIFTPLLVKTIAGKWYPQMAPDDRRESAEQISYNARGASRTAWYWIANSWQTCEDLEEAAKTLRVPVLYLYGRESDFLEPLIQDHLCYFQTWLPAVHVVGIEGGVHDLAFQKPREVASLLLDFMSSAP